MKLYEFGVSRSLRPRWMLQELQVEFEAVPVDLARGEHRQPAFLAINPVGRVPVLVNGAHSVTESIAIVLYLAEKYGERGLLPEDLRERAQCYRWLLFATTELEQPLWRILRHSKLYPEEERLAADVTLARREFALMADVLAEHMKEREFVVGDRFSVADIVVAHTLDWGAAAGLLDWFPGLVRYVERMYARPRAPRRIAPAARRGAFGGLKADD